MHGLFCVRFVAYHFHGLDKRGTVFNIRLKQVLLYFCAMILGGCLMAGCQMKVAKVQARTEPDVENGYLGLLDELTGIMRDQKGDPAQQLEMLRKWAAENHGRVTETIKKFNQDVLDMPPDKREQWRQTAQPELEKRLDNYAKSQIAFKKRLNDAQKWELGEILAQLK